MLKNGKYPDEGFLFGEIWVKPFEGKLEGELDRRVLFLSRVIHDYEAPVVPLGLEIKLDFCRVCERYSLFLADHLSRFGDLSWVTAYEQIELSLEHSKFIK
jgi:hypothetical protein